MAEEVLPARWAWHAALALAALLAMERLQLLRSASIEASELRLSTAPSAEHQAFVDKFPVSKFFDDPYTSDTFGPSILARPPKLLHNFDWTMHYRGHPEFTWALDHRTGKSPQTVLSGHDQAAEVIRESKGWSGDRQGRVLVLMGMGGTTRAALGETEDEATDTVIQLNSIFSRVYTVSNDMPGVLRTMPLGLDEAPLRGAFMPRAAAAISAARLDDVGKSGMVLAAHGTDGEAADIFGGPLRSFTPTAVPNTSVAMTYFRMLPFYNEIPAAQPRRSHQAGQVPKTVSRFQATKWLMSAAAKNARVEVRNIPRERWWKELSRYRFIMSPMGEEVQTTRNIEALLVLTIPIVQRGPYRVFDDLVAMGFPMVVVNEWEEINKERLRGWQLDLTPRLTSFRKFCLTSTAWWLMVTGAIESCH